MDRKLHTQGKPQVRERLAASGGYFTVEATLVMVLVLYVCISVIFLGFFQYDRCLMRQDAYRAALRGSSVYKGDKLKVYTTVSQMLQEFDEDDYVATKYEYEISLKDSVKVWIKGGVRMPFNGIMGFLGTVEWQLMEYAESKCIDPVTFIKLCRQLGIEPKE